MIEYKLTYVYNNLVHFGKKNVWKIFNTFLLTKTLKRSYFREFTSEQPPFFPFRVGRSDIFMKRIRKVEVNPHYYVSFLFKNNKNNNQNNKIAGRIGRCNGCKKKKVGL